MCLRVAPARYLPPSYPEDQFTDLLKSPGRNLNDSPRRRGTDKKKLRRSGARPTSPAAPRKACRGKHAAGERRHKPETTERRCEKQRRSCEKTKTARRGMQQEHRCWPLGNTSNSCPVELQRPVELQPP